MATLHGGSYKIPRAEYMQDWEPSNPSEGELWYHTGKDIYYKYQNGAWTISGIGPGGTGGEPTTRVPAGLIIPLNSAIIPDGWEAWDTGGSSSPKIANIIGAGDTYAVGASGGGGPVAATISSVGAHDGTVMFNQNEGPQLIPPTPYLQVTFGYNFGSHTHTANFSHSIERRRLILIKSLSDIEEFPSNGVILSNSTSLGSLTQQFSGIDGILYANKDYVDHIDKLLYLVSCSTNGSHQHFTLIGNNGYTSGGLWNATYRNIAGGGHYHDTIDGGFTYTTSIKEVFLRAFTNTISNFIVESGSICMYESLTPPNGWYLCDGSQGTPDLRNYFINIGDSQAPGTKQGNNTININTNLTKTVTHDHRGNFDQYSYRNAWYHTSFSWSHTHTATYSGAWTPQYYALAFIMKS